MPQDHKSKQTKGKAIKEIANHYENELKKNFNKNLVMGGEIMCQSILDLINSGKNLDEIKEFCDGVLKLDDKVWESKNE